MIGDPVYVRPARQLYRIRSDPSYPIFAGVGPGDRQLLWFETMVIVFDRSGRFLTIRDRDPSERGPGELRLEERPIEILRFWLPDRWIGVSDIPHALLGLPRDPDQYAEKDREFVSTSDWVVAGNFCLRNGRGDLFISGEGDCQLLSLRHD